MRQAHFRNSEKGLLLEWKPGLEVFNFRFSGPTRRERTRFQFHAQFRTERIQYP